MENANTDQWLKPKCGIFKCSPETWMHCHMNCRGDLQSIDIIWPTTKPVTISVARQRIGHARSRRCSFKRASARLVNPSAIWLTLLLCHLSCGASLNVPCSHWALKTNALSQQPYNLGLVHPWPNHNRLSMWKGEHCHKGGPHWM